MAKAIEASREAIGKYERNEVVPSVEVANFNINLPLNFNQVVDLVRQLPYKEKLKLSEVLKKETKQKPENDNILTHFASEKVLVKDWLLPEEDEAWKDL